MNAIYVIFAILISLVAAVVVTCILLQQKKATGVSASIAGMGGTTYWDKNKKRSKEGRLEFYTKLSGAVFLILVLLFPFLTR